MSANQNAKKHLVILEVEPRTAKSGRVYRVAQCYIKGDKIEVGELMLFNDQLQVVPGEYEAEFEVSRSFDRNITASLVALRPVSAVKPALRP